MAASKLKLTIEQGATFKKVLTWKAGAVPAPVDLTGCTARMHIRGVITDTLPLITLTTENGGITLGGAAGTILLLITATATSAITWTAAVYDLEIILPAAPEPEVRRLLYGPVVVSPEVTR